MEDLIKTHHSMPKLDQVLVSSEYTNKQGFKTLDYGKFTPQLIQCMAYCSLFPKDFELKKTDVINLWMAQGFLDPPLNGSHQTPHFLGHQYFMLLLSEGVFEGATRNEVGEVISCRMDNYSHHIALEIASGVCRLVNCEHEDLLKAFYKENNREVIDTDDDYTHDLHHVSFIVGSSWEAPEWLLDSKQLRSLFVFPNNSDIASVTIKNLEQLLSNFTSLHALDLGKADLHNLPDSIGELKHLRYLRLGGPLESLPQSITTLRYLQNLDLQACPQLRKIPNKFINNNVTIVLPADHHQFTVDESNSLVTLVGSSKATGKFEIFFKRLRQRAISEARAADLKSKLIDDLVFEWSSSYQVPDAQVGNGEQELILKRMKPPRSLKSLTVRSWKGTRFPSWEMSPYVNLPRLVSIEIEGCNRCTYLPSFSRLPLLRYLRLANLKALEYIEDLGAADGYIDNELASAAYFPSLENLKLEELPELKGWSGNIRHQVFPQLFDLRIHLCSRLMSMPQVPSLKSLHVEEIHGKLLKHLQGTKGLPTASSTLSAPSKLRDLQITSVSQLNSLSIHLFKQMFLRIKRCDELVDLKVATTSMSSDIQVEVYNCGRLRHISGELKDIRELKIWHCEELELWDMGRSSLSTGVESAAWQGLTELRNLTLGSISKLESLPRGLACLTGLRELKIFQLRKLRALPEWIGHLTQLQRLEIVDCPNMRTLFISSSAPKLDSSRINVPVPPWLLIRIERCQGLVDNLFGGTPISFRRLEIHRCDRLKDLSGEVLVIKELLVNNCQELHLWKDNGEGSSSSSGIVGSAACWQRVTGLKYLKLERISKLESFPRGLSSLTALTRLKICELPNFREVPQWIGNLTELKRLEIEDCPNMRMLFFSSPGAGSVGSEAWQRLTRLESLTLKRISKLESLPEGLACLTLKKLKILKLPEIRELPEFIGNISQLEFLTIEDCPKLTALPESLRRLTSLRYLILRQCNPELKRRCEVKTGEDWPKIRRISRVIVE